MSENHLEIKLDKCHFLQDSIIYLGYLVDQSGIRPNPQNVVSVQKFPIPRNVKEVRGFLGLTSYFRRFIPNCIIPDCGTVFTSQSFKDFCSQHDIKHIQVATATPRANGQAVRVNKSLIPMLSKIVDSWVNGTSHLQ